MFPFHGTPRVFSKKEKIPWRLRHRSPDIKMRSLYLIRFIYLNKPCYLRRNSGDFYLKETFNAFNYFYCQFICLLPLMPSSHCIFLTGILHC